MENQKENTSSVKFENEEKLVKFKDYFYIMRNAKQLLCPYKTPKTVQFVVTKAIEEIGKENQPEVHNEQVLKPCNSSCALFNFSRGNQGVGIHVELCCGKGRLIRFANFSVIEEKPEPETPPTSTLGIVK